MQPEFKPIWSPFQRGRWVTHPLLGFYLKKLCNFKANFLHKPSCKQLWLVLSWALTFYKNSKSLILQKSTKYSLLVQERPSPLHFCLQRPRPPNQYFSAASSASPFLFSSTPVPALVLILPPTAMTSSQPPAISAYLVWNPEVKSSSFSFRENQSLLDSPPSYKKIPESVPDDVKMLLKKFPSILCTGDVKPTPNHRSSITSTPVATPHFCKFPPPRSRKIANRQS